MNLKFFRCATIIVFSLGLTCELNSCNFSERTRNEASARFKRNSIYDTTKWQLVVIKDKSKSPIWRDEGSLTFTGRSTGAGVFLYLMGDTSFMNVVAGRLNKDTFFGRRNKDTLFRSWRNKLKDTLIIKRQTIDSLVLSQDTPDAYLTHYYVNLNSYKELITMLEYKPFMQQGYFDHATKWRLISDESTMVYKDGKSSSKMDMLVAPNNKRKIELYLVNDSTVMQIASFESSGTHNYTDTVFKKRIGNLIVQMKVSALDSFYINKITTDSLIIQQTTTAPGETHTYTKRYVSSNQLKH